MRNKYLASIAAFALVASNLAIANAASSTDLVSDITLQGTQFARIAVTTASGARPACHNAAYTIHYGFDLGTNKGRALLSTATAALLAGKRVTATGAGSCTNLGTVTIETLDSLTIWP
jgi:hypothetical protein